MPRVTLHLDEETEAALAAWQEESGRQNRSEAVRDLLREALRAQAPAAQGPCVAAVSYVYDHHERDLAARLTHAQHDAHDLGVATLHAHLDHHHCVEVMLLKGEARAVRQLAEATLAERGVRFGRINLIPVAEVGPAHTHGAGVPHRHLRPKTG
jgi:CopG family transcriptional regulator, nickel-responsive regulator